MKIYCYTDESNHLFSALNINEFAPKNLLIRLEFTSNRYCVSTQPTEKAKKIMSTISALFLAAVSVAVYATDSHHDLVLTPFGRVKLSCVHYFPKGAVVKELANHTELHHADGRYNYLYE